mgnify:CR=1 FL=1
MLMNYLPTFHVLEPNNLTGLRNGHMLAQFPAATGLTQKTVGTAKFVENGLFVALGADGKVKNYATGDAQLFVVFNEELNTIVPGHKYYATDLAEETPRAVAMYIGDTVTTDYFDKGATTAPKFAKISTAGVATLQDAADNDTAFVAVKSTLADGTEAYELTLYRLPTAKATGD